MRERQFTKLQLRAEEAQQAYTELNGVVSNIQAERDLAESKANEAN